jgi:hypothetical protein
VIGSQSFGMHDPSYAGRVEAGDGFLELYCYRHPTTSTATARCKPPTVSIAFRVHCLYL